MSSGRDGARATRAAPDAARIPDGPTETDAAVARKDNVVVAAAAAAAAVVVGHKGTPSVSRDLQMEEEKYFRHVIVLMYVGVVDSHRGSHHYF